MGHTNDLCMDITEMIIHILHFWRFEVLLIARRELGSALTVLDRLTLNSHSR